MARCLRLRCECNHAAVKTKEKRLFLHDEVAPSAGHLYSTIHTSHEDRNVGDEQRRGEKLKSKASQRLLCFFGKAVSWNCERAQCNR
jgi:hypothetical protein